MQVCDSNNTHPKQENSIAKYPLNELSTVRALGQSPPEKLPSSLKMEALQSEEKKVSTMSILNETPTIRMHTIVIASNVSCHLSELLSGTVKKCAQSILLGHPVI